MKIDDLVKEQRVDELSAGQVGQAAGSGVRAVGKGIADFSKGFAQGFMGKKPGDATTTQPTAGKPAASAAPKGAPAGTAAKGPLDDIKSAIIKLSPKQRAAIRAQIAKKAGVK